MTVWPAAFHPSIPSDSGVVGALRAAGLGAPAEHALISLLALNGLQVSEATGADIEALGTERGHQPSAAGWRQPICSARATMMPAGPRR
jgi:hypothetical protein